MILEAALAYAEAGFHVFPVKRDKRPLTKHGCKDASVDPVQIERWWTQWPDANIGVATGAVSGFIVVDVDNLENAPDLPPTLTSRTGSGGLHLLLKYPGQPVVNSQSKLAPGVDVRGDGGYVVMPPSVHENGCEYRWVNELPIAHIPDTLLPQLLRVAPPVATAPPRAYPPADADTLDQARGLLRDHGPAISGQGGDAHTFQVGCILLNDYALALDQALPLALEWNNTCQPPWTANELLTKLQSGAKYPTGPYGYLRDNPLRITVDSFEAEPESDLFEDLNTDAGNAALFRKYCGDDFRHVSTWHRWVSWTGTHWAIDETGAAERGVDKVARILHAESDRASDRVRDLTGILAQLESSGLVVGRDDDSEAERLRKDVERAEGKQKNLWKRCLTLQSVGGVGSTLRRAQTDLHFAVTNSALDADPLVFNVANGTLDLKTGALRPHSRVDLLTRCASVVYDPAARCPRWEAFLADILAPDVVTYLQAAVGYTLTGSVTSQCLFFLHGDGANGKSTFVNVVRALLGPYAKTGAASLLEATAGKHPTEIADLAGARMVTLTETEEGRTFPAALVKTLTSEEDVKARRMGEDFWSFAPSHKLWISGNHRPEIRGTDGGIWRRIKLIPFTRVVPEANRDTELAGKLIEELPGILNWALVGVRVWLRSGLPESKTVDVAVREYRANENTYQQFLNDECVLSGTCDRRELYNTFVNWCAGAGIKSPVTRNKFYQELRRFGVSDSKSNGKIVFRGVSLSRGNPPPPSVDVPAVDEFS